MLRVAEESLRLKAVGVGYRLAWFLTRKLPEPWAARLFEALGRRSYRRNEFRRSRVSANLRTVVPPDRLEATTREAFRTYSRYWMETFRLPDLPSHELTRRFAVEGIEHVEKAYAAGAGAVLATMHLGNWDAGGRWVAERWPLTAVVEVLRPRKLFERFVDHRRALGMEIIALEREQDVTGACVRHLQEGRLLALVADRDLSGTGIEVEMFGRRAKLPPGPAVLSLRTGAPLIPAVITMTPGGCWQAFVYPPVERAGSADDREVVEDMTRILARSFEEFVLRDPSQWHAMFQRYWLDQ